VGAYQAVPLLWGVVTGVDDRGAAPGAAPAEGSNPGLEGRHSRRDPGNHGPAQKRPTGMRHSAPILTAIALVAVTGCGAAASTSSPAATASLAVALAPKTTATVTTTGTGTVFSTPDVMTIQIGIDNTAPHAALALQSNNKTAATVQAALVRHGVAVADIQTSQLSLGTEQAHGKVRFQVTDELTATLRNLSKAGAIVDAALAAAGDAGRLDGVSFSIANDTNQLARARRQAVTSAHTDALQLAEAAGLKLVAFRSIVDQTDQDEPQSDEFSASGSSSPVAAVPVQPGTLQTIVQITAVWTLSS
jgi:uncharacterized protein YggE